MRRLLVPASLLMGIFFICPEAHAASPTEQLRGFFSAATRILDPQTGEGLEARMAAIRAIVKEIVDVPAAAQLSLGPNWSARTAAERDEFVRLFAELLERSLIGAIAGRIRLPDGVQVSYLGESVDGAVATVWTTILTKRGMDLPFTYRMKARAGGWAIRDVVIDGVSVAANYRAQFLRIMQLSSYQELVRQMRARVPETLTGSLVATAVADEARDRVGTPPTPSTTRRATRSRREGVGAGAAWRPRQRGRCKRASGHTLAARSGDGRGRACPVRSDRLADECGRARGGGQRDADRSASRSAQPAPPAAGGGAVRARLERQVLLGAGRRLQEPRGGQAPGRPARRAGAFRLAPTGSRHGSWAADIC